MGLTLDELQVQKAQNAIDRAAALVMGELSNTKNEFDSRINRLDSKPRAVSFVPNSVLYYGIVAGCIFAAYKFLS